MIKIAIIGGGTSSAVTALGLLDAELQEKVQSGIFDISIIHDPTLPSIQVGESCSPHVNRALHDILNFNVVDDLKDIDGTVRNSTKYFWKEGNNKDFYVTYPGYGLHVNSEKFSSWVFKKLVEKYPERVREVFDNIISIDQKQNSVNLVSNKQSYKFEFVIDCRGTPSKDDLESDLYTAPSFQAVNSVIIFPEFKQYNETFTSSHIHNNGWMFGVPLTHRKAWGYLYDNTITSTNEALEDFRRIKNITPADKLRSLSWSQYYRKSAIDNRVFYNGNKLYFFEPHQAMPLHYYLLLARNFARFLIQDIDVSNLNNFYTKTIENIQNLIAINYAGENNLNTKFWNAKKEAAEKQLNSSQEFKNYCLNNYDKRILDDYWPHNGHLMKAYITGYNINLKQFIN